MINCRTCIKPSNKRQHLKWASRSRCGAFSRNSFYRKKNPESNSETLLENLDFYFFSYLQILRTTKQFKFQCCDWYDPYRGVKPIEVVTSTCHLSPIRRTEPKQEISWRPKQIRVRYDTYYDGGLNESSCAWQWPSPWKSPCLSWRTGWEILIKDCYDVTVCMFEKLT